MMPMQFHPHDMRNTSASRWSRQVQIQARLFYDGRLREDPQEILWTGGLPRACVPPSPAEHMRWLTVPRGACPCQGSIRLQSIVSARAAAAASTSLSPSHAAAREATAATAGDGELDGLFYVTTPTSIYPIRAPSGPVREVILLPAAERRMYHITCGVAWRRFWGY